MTYALRAFLTEPLSSLGLVDQAYASEVEPLVRTFRVIACYHISIGYVLAETVKRLSETLLVCCGHRISLLLVVLSSLLRSLWGLASKGAK
jgi:hypothetical protein